MSRSLKLGLLSLLIGLSGGWRTYGADADDEPIVQTRGPVHEAFAQPLTPAPEPGPVVPKKPPEPISELPAEQKPEGDVIWIPGYWAWDDEREGHIWVSGFWRQPPEGRRWVPGYWVEADGGGWQWVPGFWAPADREEVPYQPAPPASLDYGPVTPSPGDDYVYSPGYWTYRDRYYWRPGGWMQPRPGCLWVPPYYSWTPNGCVFVDGYWDYPLADRGLLFAPVAFNTPLWNNSGWYYRPRYGVGLVGLLASLFVRPAWNQYCFGDYYAPGYFNRGYYPWYSYGSNGYDPLYSYYGWANRGNPNWRRNQRNLYAGRVNGDYQRPPRTLAQQNTLLSNNVTNNTVTNVANSTPNLEMVTPINRTGARNRLNALTGSQLAEQQQSIQRLQELARARNQTERRNRSGANNGAAQQQASLSLPPLPPSQRRLPNSALPVTNGSPGRDRDNDRPAPRSGANAAPGSSRIFTEPAPPRPRPTPSGSNAATKPAEQPRSGRPPVDTPDATPNRDRPSTTPRAPIIIPRPADRPESRPPPRTETPRVTPSPSSRMPSQATPAVPRTTQQPATRTQPQQPRVTPSPSSSPSRAPSQAAPRSPRSSIDPPPRSNGSASRSSAVPRTASPTFSSPPRTPSPSRSYSTPSRSYSAPSHSSAPSRSSSGMSRPSSKPSSSGSHGGSQRSSGKKR